VIQEFQSSVERAFAPLAHVYGFRPLKYEADPNGYEVVLGNGTTALRVRLEPREGLFVSLLKPHDGIIPTRDLDDRMRDPINGFDVDDLIQARLPTFRVPSTQPLAGKSLTRTLEAYATFLMDNARDVLSGDFSVFAVLAQLVAERIRSLESKGHSIGPDSRAFLSAMSRIEQQGHA